ncbi:MAG: hypothetical protein C9356_02820 [Oleiphilus sp.]|nr:MAG: hypothetical protein C9356_02820 [Oleiphilus sp.]
MDHRFLSAFVLIWTILVSGCASDPTTFLGAAYDTPHREPINNKREGLLVSYLSRGLVDSGERQEVLARVKGEYLASLEKESLYKEAVGAGLIADALVGQHQSSLGSDVRVATLAASGVATLVDSFNSDERENISQAYLPEVFNGELLDSQEKAQKVLRGFVHAKLEGLAQSLGWSVSSIDHTEDNWLLYVFNPAKHTEYEYMPESIIATFYLGEVHPVYTSAAENVLLGFNPKWATRPGNTFYLQFLFAPRIPDKEHSYGVDDEGNLWHKNYGDGVRTLLGRNLLRLFYDTPYFVRGVRAFRSKAVIYNGNVYHPSSSASNGIFIWDRLDGLNNLNLK